MSFFRSDLGPAAVQLRAEPHKRPGVSYVVSDGGLELPVIDLSHPAFAFDDSPATIEALARKHLAEEAQRARLPGFLGPAVLRFFLKRSVIGRGLLGAHHGFLDGMSTYLMKLGPENLGAAYANQIDRRIAGSLSGLSLRMRLRAMVELLADGLLPQLEARPGAPLVLVNIAGGPAADSLNALIRLRGQAPALLAGRAIDVHLLDLKPAGPDFAKGSLQALQRPGAPLQGLGAALTWHAYDWTQPQPLADLLQSLPAGAVLAMSSEGGLFDYGSDAVIAANLQIVRRHAGAGRRFVGTISRKNSVGRLSQRSVAAVQPRSVEELQALAGPAGWTILTVKETPISLVFALESR